MNIPARWAYMAVFIGVCGHASSEFFAKLTGVAGPEVSVWRYMIGAAGLVLWSLSRADSRDLVTPLREDWRSLVPLSLLGISLAYLFFHWALDFASVIQVATLVTTIPIFVGIGNLVVNRTPISTVKMATGLLAVLGVAMLMTDGYLDILARGNSFWGVLIGGTLRCPCRQLFGLGQTAYGAPWRHAHHNAGNYNWRCRALDRCGPVLGALGQPVVAGRNACDSCLVPDRTRTLEHDHHATFVAGWTGGSARHDPGRLPVFSKAGYRRPVGHRDSGRHPHLAAGAGDNRGLRFGIGGDVLATNLAFPRTGVMCLPDLCN